MNEDDIKHINQNQLPGKSFDGISGWLSIDRVDEFIDQCKTYSEAGFIDASEFVASDGQIFVYLVKAEAA